eukprot:12543685-Heterocapsa_arctica.AAC.1
MPCKEHGITTFSTKLEADRISCIEQRTSMSNQKEETVIGSRRGHQRDVAKLAEHGRIQQRVGGHHGAEHKITKQEKCVHR